MDIEVSKLLGVRLQGEPKGRKDFARLCEVLSGTPPGELVALNFEKVEVATGSWVSACILPLFRWASDEQTDLYFLITHGLGAEWLYDLRLVARYSDQCFLVTGKNSMQATLVGPMDDAHRRALELVIGLGQATGAELERQCRVDKVGPTAWNNRLRDLNEQRLLRRIKRGREQVYSPVLKVISFDGRELPSRAGAKR